MLPFLGQTLQLFLGPCQLGGLKFQSPHYLFHFFRTIAKQYFHVAIAQAFQIQQVFMFQLIVLERQLDKRVVLCQILVCVLPV